MSTSGERMVAVSGAELCTQAFGQAGSPPILLMMGQMASMLWWPDDLCRLLADGGRYVLRYDHRLTVTAISTTAVGAPAAALPGPSAAYLEHARAAGDLDWSDAGAIAEMLVGESRALTGAGREFDETATREFVERDLARTGSPASLHNHALIADGALRADVADIEAPVLVIHGTADPLFPFEHGVAVAKAARDAELVALDGGGHELHRSDWGRIAQAVVGHTSA